MTGDQSGRNNDCGFQLRIASRVPIAARSWERVPTHTHAQSFDMTVQRSRPAEDRSGPERAPFSAGLRLQPGTQHSVPAEREKGVLQLSALAGPDRQISAPARTCRGYLPVWTRSPSSMVQMVLAAV